MKSHFVLWRILILQNLVLFQIGMKPKFQHFSMKGKTLGSLHFWQAAKQGRVLETLSLSSKGFPCDWQDWDQWAWKSQHLPFSQAAARLQNGDSIHHSPAFHMVVSGELGAAALPSLLLVWLGPVCCMSLLHDFGFLKGFPKYRPSLSIPLWELGPWNSVSLGIQQEFWSWVPSLWAKAL